MGIFKALDIAYWLDMDEPDKTNDKDKQDETERKKNRNRMMAQAIARNKSRSVGGMDYSQRPNEPSQPSKMGSGYTRHNTVDDDRLAKVRRFALAHINKARTIPMKDEELTDDFAKIYTETYRDRRNKTISFGSRERKYNHQDIYHAAKIRHADMVREQREKSQGVESDTPQQQTEQHAPEV